MAHAQYSTRMLHCPIDSIKKCEIWTFSHQTHFKMLLHTVETEEKMKVKNSKPTKTPRPTVHLTPQIFWIKHFCYYRTHRHVYLLLRRWTGWLRCVSSSSWVDRHSPRLPPSHTRRDLHRLVYLVDSRPRRPRSSYHSVCHGSCYGHSLHGRSHHPVNNSTLLNTPSHWVTHNWPLVAYAYPMTRLPHSCTRPCGLSL